MLEAPGWLRWTLRGRATGDAGLHELHLSPLHGLRLHLLHICTPSR